MSLEEMMTGYLECALWSSPEDDGGKHLDATFCVSDVSEEARSRAEADCSYFLSRTWAMAAKEDLGRVGHDLWLTRNGHGAGFWDGDYPEHGDALTAVARGMGEIDIYPGDDGKMYFQ
jgi:hypothetical protein